MTWRNFCGLACALLFLAGCGKTTGNKIIVLQTGRMSGNVYPLELKGLAPLQHYPYLASYVKQVREEAAKEGTEVLLIDSGDSLLGSFASHATGAQNVVSLFNELNYDAVFLGNLDANLDENMLSKLKAPVLIPFVASNHGPAMAGAQNGLKLMRGKNEIVLLPNFYGNLAKEESPNRFPMWFGSSPGEVKPLRDYRSVMASLGGLSTDPLVIFHWMKFEPSFDAPEAYLKELKGLGVNLILAHSIYSTSQRDTWNPRNFSSWGIPVSENILRQNRGFTVARVDMIKTSQGWKQEGLAKIIPLNANLAQADPSIIKVMSPFADEIRKADEVLGQIDKPVSEEALLKSHMATLGSMPGATVVVYSGTAVRGGLDAGKLTAGKLYNALPWTNQLNLIDLTPDQYARLKLMKGFSLLSRPGSDTKPVLVTSRYFARLLQSPLALQESQIRPAGTLNEFDFVKAALKAGLPLPSSNPETGNWIYAKLE